MLTATVRVGGAEISLDLRARLQAAAGRAASAGLQKAAPLVAVCSRTETTGGGRGP